MKYKAKKVIEKADSEVSDADKSKKNWYTAPAVNSPDFSPIKKFSAVAFMLIAVAAMILLAMQKINWIEFWLTTIFCAIFAWKILPKIK